MHIVKCYNKEVYQQPRSSCIKSCPVFIGHPIFCLRQQKYEWTPIASSTGDRVQKSLTAVKVFKATCSSLVFTLKNNIYIVNTFLNDRTFHYITILGKTILLFNDKIFLAPNDESSMIPDCFT